MIATVVLFNNVTFCSVTLEFFYNNRKKHILLKNYYYIKVKIFNTVYIFPLIPNTRKEVLLPCS